MLLNYRYTAMSIKEGMARQHDRFIRYHHFQKPCT